MSDFTDIRAGLLAKLNALSGIGKVHNKQRFNVDWSSYLSNFKDTDGAIRGWYITPASEGTISAEFTVFGKTARAYQFMLVGILGVQDAGDTEGAFLTMAETVLNGLLGINKLGSGTTPQLEVTAASLSNYTYRQFGSVFCHYGEITLTVTTEVTG